MLKNLFFISALFVLTNAFAFAENKPTHRCFDQAHFQFCVPSIGRGNNLLTPIYDNNHLVNMDGELKYLLKISAPDSFGLELSPDSQAEKDLKNSRPNANIFSISNYFQSFIKDNFNKYANFSGPNCYNTALIAAGIIPPELRIYVGPKEFELYLSIYTERVFNNLEYGDIVVYDASGGRPHTALYLFNGLVFHKKGFSKNYSYRITHIDESSKIEPFEWEPSPYDTIITSPVDWDKQPKAFYRRKANIDWGSDPTPEEQKAIDTIIFISQAVLKHAPYWAIGKEMGIISESNIDDLLSELRFMEKSPSLRAQLAYQHLDSLKDQIFQSIEETHYSSKFAMPSKINEEYCFTKNEYLNQSIDAFLRYFKGASSVAARNKIIKALDKIDRKKCDKSIINLIKDL